jgi:hypothetical protein
VKQEIHTCDACGITATSDNKPYVPTGWYDLAIDRGPLTYTSRDFCCPSCLRSGINNFIAEMEGKDKATK